MYSIKFGICLTQKKSKFFLGLMSAKRTERERKVLLGSVSGDAAGQDEVVAFAQVLRGE